MTMLKNSDVKLINSIVKIISKVQQETCHKSIEEVYNWINNELGVDVNKLTVLDKLYYDVLSSENEDKQSFSTLVKFIIEIFENYEFLRIHLFKSYYNKYVDDKSGIILEVPAEYFDKYKDFFIDNNFYIVDGMVCGKGFILFFNHKDFLFKCVGLNVKFFYDN